MKPRFSLRNGLGVGVGVGRTVALGGEDFVAYAHMRVVVAEVGNDVGSRGPPIGGDFPKPSPASPTPSSPDRCRLS